MGATTQKHNGWYFTFETFEVGPYRTEEEALAGRFFLRSLLYNPYGTRKAVRIEGPNPSETIQVYQSIHERHSSVVLSHHRTKTGARITLAAMVGFDPEQPILRYYVVVETRGTDGEEIISAHPFSMIHLAQEMVDALILAGGGATFSDVKYKSE